MPVKKKTSRKKTVFKKPARRKKTALRKKPARKVVKKALKRKPVSAKNSAAAKKEKAAIIGLVTHYFPKVRAAVIKLKQPLAIGDAVKIKGHTTEFIQIVNSLQIDHVPVTSAKKGQEIGLLVDSRVRQHDVVYKP